VEIAISITTLLENVTAFANCVNTGKAATGPVRAALTRVLNDYA
jgi:hypothetical protein